MAHDVPSAFCRRLAAGLCAIALVSCSQTTNPLPLHYDAEAIRTHVSKLEAAERHGAGVGTAGEAIAKDYVAEVFRANNLKPLVQPASFIQPISFFRLQTQTAEVKITGPRGPIPAERGTDFVAWTRQAKPSVSVKAPIVFAGFGIIAPEFKWDDFKDVDVRGKVIVVLDDDPHNGERDRFGDLGRNYYGRRTYKFDEAGRRGAAGVFIIHEEKQTGDRWTTIVDTAAGERLAVDELGEHAPPAALVEGWLTFEAAAKLFQLSGHDFKELKDSAEETNFRPVVLNSEASITVESTITRVKSANVAGAVEGQTVEGQTPEYVVVASRWNRVGVLGAPGEVPTPRLHDDVSGCAVLLEVARVFGQRPPPRRTLVFLVTTAHPEGLVGLRYFAGHPVVPADKTIAMIFIDGVDVFSDSRFLRTIGPAFQGLSEIVKVVGSEHGRILETEHDRDKLFYYKWSRSAFAEQGIPDIYLTTSVVPPQGQASRDQGHGPSQLHTIGAIRDADLLFNLVATVADATNWPALKRPAHVTTAVTIAALPTKN